MPATRFRSAPARPLQEEIQALPDRKRARVSSSSKPSDSHHDKQKHDYTNDTRPTMTATLPLHKSVEWCMDNANIGHLSNSNSDSQICNNCSDNNSMNDGVPILPVGRENEERIILNTIISSCYGSDDCSKDSRTKPTAACLYVSGVPGCGKTLTLSAITKRLFSFHTAITLKKLCIESISTNSSHNIRGVIWINAMHITDMANFYLLFIKECAKMNDDIVKRIQQSSLKNGSTSDIINYRHMEAKRETDRICREYFINSGDALKSKNGVTIDVGIAKKLRLIAESLLVSGGVSGSLFCSIVNDKKNNSSTAKMNPKLEMSNQRSILILVIDEVDQLMFPPDVAPTTSKNKRNQNVLIDDIINIYELPTRYPMASLVVIGIANSIDLSSKYIEPSLLSRWEKRHHGRHGGANSVVDETGDKCVQNPIVVVFEPYDKLRLINILRIAIARMNERNAILLSSHKDHVGNDDRVVDLISIVVDDQALDLCARKILSGTADVRRAIELLHSAVRIAKQAPPVSLSDGTLGVTKGCRSVRLTAGHVMKAISTLFAGPSVTLTPKQINVLQTPVTSLSTTARCIISLPQLPKTVFCALIAVFAKIDSDQSIPLSPDLRSLYIDVCRAKGLVPVSDAELWHACETLCDSGLFKIEIKSSMIPTKTNKKANLKGKRGVNNTSVSNNSSGSMMGGVGGNVVDGNGVGRLTVSRDVALSAVRGDPFFESLVTYSIIN